MPGWAMQQVSLPCLYAGTLHTTSPRHSLPLKQTRDSTEQRRSLLNTHQRNSKEKNTSARQTKGHTAAALHPCIRPRLSDSSCRGCACPSACCSAPCLSCGERGWGLLGMLQPPRSDPDPHEERCQVLSAPRPSCLCWRRSAGAFSQHSGVRLFMISADGRGVISLKPFSAQRCCSLSPQHLK